MDRDDFLSCEPFTAEECSLIGRMRASNFDYCDAAFRDVLLHGYGIWFM